MEKLRTLIDDMMLINSAIAELADCSKNENALFVLTQDMDRKLKEAWEVAVN